MSKDGYGCCCNFMHEINLNCELNTKLDVNYDFSISPWLEKCKIMCYGCYKRK